MSVTENQCERMQDLLSDYVDGRLDPAEAARVEAHIARCLDCDSFLGFLKATSFVVANRMPDVAPPAALFERIAQATYARPTWQQRIATFLAPAPTRLALGTAFAAGVFALLVAPHLYERHVGHSVPTTPVADAISPSATNVSSSVTNVSPSAMGNPKAVLPTIAPNSTTHSTTPIASLTVPAKPTVAQPARVARAMQKPARTTAEAIAAVSIAANKSNANSRNRAANRMVALVAPRTVTVHPSNKTVVPRLVAMETPHIVKTMHPAAPPADSISTAALAFLHKRAHSEPMQIASRNMPLGEREIAIESGGTIVPPPVALHEVASAATITAPVLPVSSPLHINAGHHLGADTGWNAHKDFSWNTALAHQGTSSLPSNSRIAIPVVSDASSSNDTK